MLYLTESTTVKVENAPQEEKLKLKPTMSTSADTAVTVLNFSVATPSQNTSTSSMKSSDSSSSDSETTSTQSSSQESAAEDSDNSPDWGEPVKTNVGTSLNEQDLAEVFTDKAISYYLQAFIFALNLEKLTLNYLHFVSTEILGNKLFENDSSKSDKLGEAN